MCENCALTLFMRIHEKSLIPVNKLSSTSKFRLSKLTWVPEEKVKKTTAVRGYSGNNSTWLKLIKQCLLLITDSHIFSLRQPGRLALHYLPTMSFNQNSSQVSIPNIGAYNDVAGNQYIENQIIYHSHSGTRNSHILIESCWLSHMLRHRKSAFHSFPSSGCYV